jgi:hypothetical protein
MMAERARYDKYGRPLPTLVGPLPRDLAASEANLAEQARLLRRIQAKLEEHYPHLLREDVNADVTVSFKIVRGTMQDTAYVGIVWQYLRDEE